MSQLSQKLQALLQVSSPDGLLDAFEDYIRWCNGDTHHQRDLQPRDSDYFHVIEYIGKKSIDTITTVGFYAIQVNGSLTEKSSKKRQFQEAKHILKADNTQAGIFLFYDDTCTFRYSFIFSRPTSKGSREFSPYERYTHFVDPQGVNTTFLRQLANLDYSSIERIQEAFSIEKVNEQFYKDIAQWFDTLIESAPGGKAADISFRLPSKTLDGNREQYQNFAVRFIGRVIFIWFLKEKKDHEGVPLIPDDLISQQAVDTYSENMGFYHAVLEPLFFETLNEHIDSRQEQRLGVCREFHHTIPYLNGGLFQPLTEDCYTPDATTGFSQYLNTLFVADRHIQNLFETLERYNFTIDENTHYDQEVSVDPEMLGRIFENLLGKLNPDTQETARKSTGSFYTPRKIVDYMVRRSVEEYLKTYAGEKIEEIETLFADDDHDIDLSDEQKQIVVDALDKVRIIDPACGSGAYPMGILQRILSILRKVDPDNSLWIEKMIAKLPNEAIRRRTREKYQNDPAIDYVRKLGIIEKSIFGVDIQESAVEIARLRFFLSLIVDQTIESSQDNRGIEPLPNLDFKFVAANSLISLPTPQGDLFDNYLAPYIQQLRECRQKFFEAHGEKKDQVRADFYRIQNTLSQTLREKDFRTYLVDDLSSWDPFEHTPTTWFDSEWMFGVTEGFDIVIGNPPYIQLQNLPAETKKALRDAKYQTFKSQGDIYALFYEKGFSLLRDNGVLCYITSNKWMRAGYGEALRDYFARQTTSLELLDFGGFKVFSSATVDTNIYLGKKTCPNSQALKATHFKNDFSKDQSIEQYKTDNQVTLTTLSSDTWFIGSPSEIKLKEKIERLGTPLKDWDVKINYGIKTGYNQAFVIDEEKRAELIKQDPKSEELIKPLLRGRDIKRYSYDWPGLYVINTHNGYIDDNGQRIPRINAGDYPAIKEHLDQYWEKISKRYDQGATPYNLRNCAYTKEFEKEKIVYPNMSSKFNAFFDTHEFITNQKCFIITGNNLKFILGILNSSLNHWYFPIIGAKLGAKGMEMSKIFVEKIPVPNLHYHEKQNIAYDIEIFVDEVIKLKGENNDTQDLEHQIDELVMDLYELTEDERKLVRGNK